MAPTTRIVGAVPGLALGLALTAAGGLAAAAEGTSQVQLVTDGKTVALPHVVAARFVAPDGQAEIRLLFASAPPGGVALADPFGGDRVREWAGRSGATTVQVTFEEAAPEQYRLTVHHEGQVTLGGGTRIAGDVRGVVRDLALAGDRVSGTMDVAGGAAVTGAFGAPMATVRAAVPVRGPRVAESPQARVLLAFAGAMSRKDFAAAQRHAVRDVQTEMEAARKQMGEAFLDQMLRDLDPARIEAQLRSPDAELLEAGDTARIRLIRRTQDASGQSTSTRSFTLTQMGGEWKVR